MEVVLKSDATAAISLANRKGLGQARHIEVNQLWLQGKVASGEVRIENVAGDKNLADALTKAVDGNKLGEHMRRTGGVLEEGRHQLAPEVGEEEETRMTMRGRGDEDG